jgi:pyruvate dehydrogenase E1 component alpha subunit
MTAAQRCEFYRQMVRIRLFEECIATHVESREIRTPCHLYIGQEAVAAGVCGALRTEDYLFSNYRGHGHYLAKGGDARAFLAEVFCRASGCSAGRGGSMHLVSPDVGVMGNTAIVAGHLSLAAGAALACKLRREDRVCVVFFGDAAVEEGVFSEVVNFAALKKLPLLMVCENNLYAAHMHISERQPRDRVACRAEPFMPAVTVDGNDVEAVHQAAARAVTAARAGGGPAFLECLTYRWRGHVGPKDDLDRHIRTIEEVEAWKERCPIRRQEQRLLEQGLAAREQLEGWRAEAEAEVRDALQHALGSPFPAPETLLSGVYAGPVE